ncbi:MAG: putative Ig domain-containing protein, partial [Acidobacteria bacterium]|nr:putative Ig domain-containing protein [Acidobacteriota bacterium]
MRFAVTGWLVICAEAALWGQTPIRFDTPSPLPDGEVGVPYEMQIRFSGGKPFLGTGIVQYTYTSNFAVPGVGMQNGTTTTHAQIGGTPTVAGTYSFTVNVNDGLGTSASMPYSVTIYPRLEIVTPSALPDAEEGAPYSFQLVWQGGIQPYTSFQCVSSIGPLGFACDQQGLITGRTSSISGRTDTYSCAIELTIQSRSRNVQRRCFDLTIRPGLAITDTQFGTGSMGQPYSHQLTAVRGKTPYTWSATGTIPAGLTFSSSGRLSGTPTQTGTFQITARVTDANGTVVGRTLSLTITAAAFAISNNSLPAGTVGQGYSQQLTASNAQGAVTWAGSGFPPGITMNSSGLISGTPTQAGTFTVFLNATDAAGRIATKTLVFSVASPQPAELALVGVGGNLTAGRVGSLYTGTILARGGTQPYTFTFTNLPPGLTASPDGGITGTPTTPGTYTINVTVTDATGQRAAGQYAIFIAEGTPPPPSKVSIVTPSPLSSAVVGTGAYTRQLEAKDGTPPYTWRVSAGQPPLGFTLSAGGLYFGVAIVGGDYSFSVTVTDSKGDTDTRSYRHTIVTLPRVTNTLIKGRVNTPYSAEVVIQGGSAPYRTRMVGGTLPRG